MAAAEFNEFCLSTELITSVLGTTFGRIAKVGAVFSRKSHYTNHIGVT